MLDSLRTGGYEMYGFINPFVVLCFSCVFLITSCLPTLVGRVHAMKDAHNRGDIEKELSFFAEDVRCDFGGTFVISGKAELRKAVEGNALFDSQMTFTDCKESGNTVTCKVKEQNDMLKAAGLGAVYYEFCEHIFENGLIKGVRAKPVEENVRALKEFRESFGKWVSETMPQESAELKVEGITKNNVNKWLALMRQWREENEKEER